MPIPLNIKRKITLCFLFLVISFLFIVWYGIYLPKSFGPEEKMPFLVKKGDNLFQIAERLEELDLIKNRFLFNFYVILRGEQRKLQAGEYLFSPGMSASEISQKIISGDVIKEKITIIEGWNLRDIAWYFENLGMFQAEELFELIGFPLIDYSLTEELPTPKDFSDEFGFLEDKPKNVNLEGYLFPDTYEVNRGRELELIVRKMLSNFDKKLTPDLREEIKIQEKSIFEIITMASLLEKEVKTSEEKKLASGVLWKRLANNIPLQVDASITYITGEKTIKVSKEDTEIDSPYNTYKYKGLPLGPICNPGLESILAAIYPEDSFYWFYLSIPGGETIFSKNYEEHNLAKAKYLK